MKAGARARPNSARTSKSSVDLELTLEARTRELRNALEQQAATSEILRVIASSPNDVQPVLDAVAKHAARLCDAQVAGIFMVDGETMKPVASYAADRKSTSERVGPAPLTRASVTGRSIIDGKTVHVGDVALLIESEYADSGPNQRKFGFRAVLASPLVRDGRAYGAIFLYRREPRMFDPDQVELVETFAHQAAIAIENVRLFNETKEALEQQTAISEILRVIANSPGDVRPMLDAVAQRALSLCGAAQATIVLADGDALKFAAAFGSTRTLREGETMPLTRGSVAGRAVIDGASIQVEDLETVSETEYPVGRELQRRVGHHTALAVPLMRESRAIGAIQLWRMEIRAFSDNQVALVKTFADQAAIAIENVRLFNETKEALEQQTAISEVLRVISGSPGDVRPMLGAVAERALRLCDAAESTIVLVEGERLRQAAMFGSTATLEEGEYIPLTRGSVTGRAVIDRTVMHMSDLATAPESEFPVARELQRRIGHHAVLSVPLMREDRAIGAIALWRMEARAFSDKQIALVKTFADQAAIAIENVRLFNATKEALDQQRASAEVLEAISNSIADTQPVFDKILESCERLFAGRTVGINLVGEDGQLRLGAFHGPGREELEKIWPTPISEETGSGLAILRRGIVHCPDVERDEGVSARTRQACAAIDVRGVIFAPMLWEGRGIGAIFVGRDYPGAFSDKDIALLKTFADQAVIAIQNARLFSETKEGLEQQTAIAEILRVISSSPTDVQPVLDAIAERAARHCDASAASMYLTEGDMLRHLASKGPSPDPVLHVDTLPINRETMTGRALLDGATIQVRDLLAEGREYPASYEIARRLGHRTAVATPLYREGHPFGVILLRRQEVRPFTDREIALLRTFGDQAAIALENVRLFNETKEALEQQRASGEVLAAISNSIADTKPVFDKIVESCAHLFAGKVITINLLGADGLVRPVAHHGPAREAFLKTGGFAVDDPAYASTISMRSRKVLHYPDQEDASVPEGTRESGRIAGTKAAIFAPMLWEGKAIGVIALGRDYVGPFSDKEIALLKTFADQAVIAIQNARLFNETTEALDQQRASGEVLAAISNSIADTAPVFDKILESCERLFAGTVIAVEVVGDDGTIHVERFRGPDPGVNSQYVVGPLEAGASISANAIMSRTVQHVSDMVGDAQAPARSRKAYADVGVGAVIVAPMLWEGKGIGCISVGREAAGSFSEKEIALLKTFADQAVIAIQNARLFNETTEALDQQRASGEVLAAISSSIADTSPVFDKILESCERLFAGKIAGINLVGDDGLVHLRAYHGPNRETLEKVFPFAVNVESGSGRAIVTRSVIHFPDVVRGEDVPETTRRACGVVGFRGVIYAPMLWEGKGIGTIFVGRDYVGPFSDKDIALLKTFADQAVIAIQNARLFREIQDKSRQLEIANKHKSEFLANMSHELRTPLNAIIGFSEVLLEKLFGDVNEKQEDYLRDIYTSGKHLLGLINDILDLSKVEAGRMDLEPSQFDLPSALSNALILVRERAQRHNVTLHLDVDPALTSVTADERKLKQILVNLLTNAVKFTPDGGRIDVIARWLPDAFSIAVRDNGIGIAKADHEAVFEEFRQVGRDYTKKQEGTGLGLTLTRRFVELHGGRIGVESEPGKGSTFTFTIPMKS